MYPGRVRELGRIGPGNLRFDTYLVGYGSAYSPRAYPHAQPRAPVALPQLPHAQPLVPLPHARLAPPLVAAARRRSLRPRRRRRATAAACRDPGPGAPRAATTSRNRGCTAAGTREPPPAWLLQRTSARLKVQRSSSPVLVLSLPLFLFPTNLPD